MRARFLRECDGVTLALIGLGGFFFLVGIGAGFLTLVGRAVWWLITGR